MDNYSYTDYDFDFSDKLTYSEGQLTPTIEENQYLPSYSPPLPSLPYGSPPLNNNNVHIYGNIMPLQVTSDKNSSMKRRRTPRDHDDLPLLSPSSTSSFSTTATTSTAEQRTERCSAPTKVSKTTGTSNASSRRATRQVDKNSQVEDNDDEEEEKLRMKNLERNRLAAYKCRQRKKEWIDELAHKAERMARENEHLRQMLLQLREEILHLKTQLILQKDNKKMDIHHPNQKI